MARIPVSFQMPTQEKITDSLGFVSRGWLEFFRLVKSYLDPMGVEKSFTLTNDLGAAANIEGLFFDKTKISQGIVEFLVQRITDTNEVVASGVIHAVYLPDSEDWDLLVPWTPGPGTSGITFSITAAGQVQYTSTNITGTEAISRIVFRVRTLAGKHSSYSLMGS